MKNLNKTTTTAVAAANDYAVLAKYLGRDPNESKIPEPKSGGNFLGFYSGKERGEDADQRKAELKAGPSDLGHPHVKHDGTFYSLKGTKFTVLADLPYWATIDSSNQTSWYSLEPHAWDAKHDGQKVKACVLAIMLIVPGDDGTFPEALGPVYPICTNLLNYTKSDCVKDHVQALKRATDAGFIAARGIPVDTPPPFRQFSAWKSVPKTITAGPAKGERYTHQQATPTNPTPAQVSAITEAMQDEDWRARFEKVTAEFERRSDELRQGASD